MTVSSLSLTARDAISQAINDHKLPISFANVVDDFYLPIAVKLVQSIDTNSVSVVGIQGSQGSGKSTCAEFIRILIREQFEKTAVVMSIDDFYLTRAERLEMSDAIHPLFKTRGVPGTHDIAMINSVIVGARAGQGFVVPSFDKAQDDRADQHLWQHITEKIDVLILEGWCVGIPPESEGSLQTPINELEELDDPEAVWRVFVNDALKTSYSSLFSQLDTLISLQAPSFDSVFGWRLLQEQKMIERIEAAGGDASGTQTPEQIKRFIAHYQRLTEHALKLMPEKADFLLRLNQDHSYQSLQTKDA